jgi:two-component system, NarL family, nitrate/nitrite response regulator NarL
LVSVLVVAEVLLYREGLTRALGQRGRISVVGTVTNAQEAITCIGRLQPEVVLLDVATTEGLAAVRSIRAAAPGAKVVALALPEAEANVIEYAEAGVSGYVSRDATLADLEAVVESVARGEVLCSPRIAASLLQRVADLAADREPAPLDVHLTSREAEIVELIDQGLSNKEIAQRLSIAVSTVKNHVHSILDKMHVDRRGKVVARLRNPGASKRARPSPSWHG